MKINEDLIITSMSLDGYDVPVPRGLSELFNRSGVWEYKNSEDTVEENNPLDDYERKVVMEKGKLRTYLTYKLPSENKNIKVS